MSDLVQLAHEIEPGRHPVVLVSLVETQGSTYRNTGARMLITPEENYGLMSGGCLEQEIAKQCEPILSGQTNQLFLHIDTRQFLGCDGRLGLWCEKIDDSLLERARTVKEKRVTLYCNTYPNDSDRTSSISEQPADGAFHEVLHPPRRMLVFGSAPDSEPLLKLGLALQWQTEQVVLANDPIASASQATVLASAKHVQRLGIDQTTACVVMNHHFGRDLELLHTLWETPTPFLGLLGSRRRRDQLLEELTERSDLDLESRVLYAPVGLNLGAEGPHQIALEICAQIQQVLQNCAKGQDLGSESLQNDKSTSLSQSSKAP